MILTDAGPLVALIDRGEQDHAVCVAALKKLRPPMITTWPAFTEAMYLLGDAGGWPAQQTLWMWVEQGHLEVLGPEATESARMHELMEKYADRPMDLAGASLVVLAERLHLSHVFTLDSDFKVYRHRGKKLFSIVP